MKKLLCKFANWILRHTVDQVVPIDGEIYINGRTYHLTQVEFEPTCQPYTFVNIRLRIGRYE